MRNTVGFSRSRFSVTNPSGVIMLLVGVVACSDNTASEPWFEAKADTISIAGNRLAIVHHDTSSDGARRLRVRVTAEVALDQFGFRFGPTSTGFTCYRPVLRREFYMEQALGAGETREVARPSLSYRDPNWASTAAIDVIRNGVRLGSPFAGQYAGTWTAETQARAATGYIDVGGLVRLSFPDVGVFAEGSIDAAGVFSGFYTNCDLSLNRIRRVRTPLGEPLVIAGSELTGTIVDSIFRPVMGMPLESTTRWTVRLTR